MSTESPESLQQMLNTLHAYKNEWKVILNVGKMKIMIFRNGVRIKENKRLFYNGREVETVDNFKGIGSILFLQNGLKKV
jgi:hypothetical protein